MDFSKVRKNQGLQKKSKVFKKSKILVETPRSGNTANGQWPKTTTGQRSRKGGNGERTVAQPTSGDQLSRRHLAVAGAAFRRTTIKRIMLRQYLQIR